jgi:UDP-N-acetylmuramate dehydrogenase
VASNAGAHGETVSQRIVSVLAIDRSAGVERRFSNEDFQWGYRDSMFRKNSDWIIWTVCVKLPVQCFDAARMRDYLKWRADHQPVRQPNAGSVFKNPQGQYAGALIEQCVGKGFAVGKAAISNEHANIFVNLGGATAKEFKALIETVKAKVKQKTGVVLEEEIIIL